MDFPIRRDGGKGQHSLRPFQRRLRVRPSFDVPPSAGAAKSLQKLIFCRQPEIDRSFVPGKAIRTHPEQELRHG